MTKVVESKLYDLSEDTIDQVKKIFDQMALPFTIKIKYIGHAKMKKLIALKKASEELAYINSIDLIVFVNEDYLLKLEEKNVEILLTQELDRLQFNMETGKFNIAKFGVQTTAGVLKKYGIDAVAEANEISELYTQQKKDGKESEFDVNSIEVIAKTKKKKNLEFLN